MSTKTCTCCGEIKGLEAFQVRRASADGRTASCKGCLKVRDKARDSNPDRLAARRNYQATPQGSERHAAANASYRKKNPLAVKAHNAVSKAILRGKITPWPCEICGEKAEAHHPHYEAPMLFTWLCDPHHKQAHADTTELEKRNAPQ